MTREDKIHLRAMIDADLAGESIERINYSGDWIPFEWSTTKAIETIPYSEQLRIRPKPRELFVNEYHEGSLRAHRTLASAVEGRSRGEFPAKTARFVEDLTWKEPQ